MKKTLLALFISTLVWGCGDKNTNTTGTTNNATNAVSTEGALLVNGKVAAPATVLAFIDSMQANVPTDADKANIKYRTQQSLVEMSVLATEAENRKLDQTDDYKAALYLEERERLVGKALQEKFIEEVKEANKKEIETQIASKLGNQKEYSAKHILVKEEAKAKEIIAKLKSGAKFDDLTKLSIEPNAAERKGSLGWSIPSVFVPEFANALTSMKEGTYSETPVKTQFGYHVIFLEASRDMSAEQKAANEKRVKQEVETTVLQPILMKKFDDLKKTIEAPATPAIELPAYVAKFLESSLPADLPKKAETLAEQKKQVIQMERLYQEAKKLGVLDTKNYQAQFFLLTQVVKANTYVKVLREEQEKKLDETKDKAEYDKLVAEQKKNVVKEYKLHHILVKDEKTAKQIIKDLTAGKTFADLAKQSIDTASAAKGGELDWSAASDFPDPALGKAIAGLEKGKYTKAPIKTNEGWHIIQLDDSRDKASSPIPYTEFKQQMQAPEIQKIMADYVKKLVDAAKLEGVVVKAPAPAEAPKPPADTSVPPKADGGAAAPAKEGAKIAGETTPMPEKSAKPEAKAEPKAETKAEPAKK